MNTLRRTTLLAIFFVALFLFVQHSFAQRQTVIISEVLYDTPLPEAAGDTFAHDGEFISLYNYGNETVDVSGWYIRYDVMNGLYTIPSGTKILPGGILVIAYRSQGSNFDVASFYSRDSNVDIPFPHKVLYQNGSILPNNVSSIKLHDANGLIQDNITYTGIVYNGEEPDFPAYMCTSLQRKTIHIDPSNGLHLFRKDDYGIGTVCLFSFNKNSTLTYTHEDGHQVIIESFDERNIYGTGSLGKALPGSLNVSATGGATYTIPIEVPQGVRGMQPQLALTYNSQSGMGIAGLGFHLQGLSAITRTTPNLFYDGYRSKEFTKFMLDGQRLKELSPLSHDTAIMWDGDLFLSSILNPDFTVYETAESPSFSDIRRDRKNNGFVVKTREGITLVYGYGDNSSLHHSKTNQKLSYLLFKAVDGYGNDIVYTYQENGGQKYIQNINYGGTEIRFIYISSPIQQIKYLIGGHEISDNKLLSKIEIRSNGELVYYYELDYESPVEKAYTILKTVRKVYQGESYGAREELPLSFLWSNANTDAGNIVMNGALVSKGDYNFYDEEDQLPDDDDNYNNPPKRNSSYVTGDVDGDGSAEVIRFGWKNVSVYRNEVRWWGSNTGIAYDADFALSPYGWRYPKNPCYVIDMNGDGCGDLVGRANQQISISYSNGFIPVHRDRFMNDQFTKTVSIKDFGVNASGNWDKIEECPVLFGDIDGDGFNDVVGVNNNGCKIYRYDNVRDTFYYYNSFSDRFINSIIDKKSNITRRYKLLDIDGDGKAELLSLNNVLEEVKPAGLGNDYVKEYFKIYAVFGLDGDLSSDNVKTIYRSRDEKHNKRNANNVNDRFFGDANHHLFGDLNGDGLIDLVAADYKYFNIFYSRGTGIYETTPDFSRWLPYPSTFEGKLLHQKPVSLGDINGDGLLDVVGFTDMDSDPEARLVVLLNTGNNFVNKLWGYWNKGSLTINENTDIYGHKKEKLLCDFNGDGISDVATVVYGNNDIYISNSRRQRDFRQLTGISDGSGVNTNIVYTKYKKTQADIYAYPFREVSGLDVVSDVKTTTPDSTVVSHQKYDYNRVVADIRRGGLLGFLSTTVTDVVNNTSAATTQQLDTKRSILYPQSVSTYLHNGNEKELLGTESYYYREIKLSSPRDTVKYLSQKNLYDTEKKFTKEIKYNMDSEGYKTKETSSILVPATAIITEPWEPLSSPSFTHPEVVQSENKVEYGDYRYGESSSGNKSTFKYPHIKITTSGYAGRYLRDTIYYTYNEQGDILTETTKEGTIETEYDNFFGLPWAVTFIPKYKPDSSITTYYDYTDDYRFLNYTDDDRDNKTTKDYDLKYGRLKSETDIFGRKKSYSYDNYGRLKSITDEDGVITSFTETINTANPGGRIIHSKSSPGSCIYTYYDVLGREVMTRTETADGVIVTETVYNNKNQVVKKSEPYFEGEVNEDTAWYYYTYDNLGRLTQTEYRGDITTYAYDKLKTTVIEHVGTSESRTTSKTYNATGDVINVTEPSGQINYHYYYPKLPDTIKSNGIKTVITYDDCGRRTSILDPSAGLTTFDYDNQNRIIEQIDANGTEIYYFYDKYGREKERRVMTEDYYNGLMIRNNYDKKGLLLESSITSMDDYDVYDVTTLYDYDDAGRLIFETQELESLSDEISFITSYDYDEYGRLSLKLFPNGFGIEYKYNTYGELSQITNLKNGSNIWQRGERNSRGQYKSSTLGRNNFFKRSSYDAWGNVTGSSLLVGMSFSDYRTYTYSGANRLMNSRGGGSQEIRGMPTIPNASDFSWNEDFDYDDENRLESWLYSFNNQIIDGTSHVYDANGNLTYKSGIGNISYYAGNPYRIDQITAPSGSTTLPRSKEVEKHLYHQTIAYTPFQRVRTVIQDSNNTDFIDSEKRTDFTYNANYERVKMRITSNGSLLKQKYYAGDYEIVQTYKFENGIKMAHETDICYIRTPEGLQAAYKRELPPGKVSIGGMINSSAVGEMYYFGTDHAGSITSVISDDGEVLERYQYDAWGNRRVSDEILNHYPRTNPTREEMRYLVLYEPLFDRGYIGEEHIDLFGLINLNARLYDPVLGRFLSPDPYVQAPDMLQNFNRYAYGLNNPLMYSDPNGEFWQILIAAAVISGVINWAANGALFNLQGLGHFGVGLAVGLGAGALGWGASFINVPGIIGGASVGGSIGAGIGSLSGITLNGFNNLLSGQNFWNNSGKAAAVGALALGTGGAIGGGVKGYQLSQQRGLNYWWGNKVKWGRTQWSFFTSELPYETISWDIKDIGRLYSDDNNCVPISLVEADNYFGGSASYDYFKDFTGYVQDVGVVHRDDRHIYKRDFLSVRFGTQYLGSSALAESEKQTIRDIKSAGWLIHTNMPYRGGRHADNLRSINYYHSGKVVLKYRIGSYRLPSVNNDWWFYILTGLK
ncbi:MAG: FG-GAP-like repeat-containing protein [Bacteroidales bacterium]|jgi:RHS repeat-associated protein|nr:FG-GAP-like repeat-containing protein [Bacteroidales bacterium]